MRVRIKRAICAITRHTWASEKRYPLYSYRDLPYAESYCTRCGITGEEWLNR